MRIILFAALFSLFLLTVHISDAQSVQDTIERAKQLRDKGNLCKALKLLGPYHAVHPDDLNSAWIYAQISYWAGRYKKSQSLYEQAIHLHPGNLYIQLDYAKMLVDIGKYAKAQPYLQNYLNYDSTNVQAQLAMAKMSFWKGHYREAASRAEALIKVAPDDQASSNLLDEITLARSPWLGLNASYYTDNQPLQTISPVIESGISLHALSTLRFRIRTPVFYQNGTFTNALWLQAGNSMFIWKGRWRINADAGILKYPYKNTIAWTGSLGVEKTSFHHLVVAAKVERKPYFSTGSSVDTVINENYVAAAIGWDNMNSWNGKVSFNLDYFLADKNSIYSFTAWGLAPPIKASVFDFRLGYGFGYSTTDENRFEPVGKKADIIANYDSTIGIKGIYYPYFTPDDQAIHSALISIGVHPVKGFDIGISGNLGVYATAQIPYFYLDTNSFGSIVIKKGFSKERYFPFTVSAFAAIQLSKKISLRADYSYNSTYFYTSHYVGLQLKVHIWRKTKRK